MCFILTEKLVSQICTFTMVVYAGSIVDSSHLALPYTLLMADILRRAIRYYCWHHLAMVDWILYWSLLFDLAHPWRAVRNSSSLMPRQHAKRWRKLAKPAFSSYPFFPCCVGFPSRIFFPSFLLVRWDRTSTKFSDVNGKKLPFIYYYFFLFLRVACIFATFVCSRACVPKLACIQRIRARAETDKKEWQVIVPSQPADDGFEWQCLPTVTALSTASIDNMEPL